jgi:hypothetical protein
MISENKWGHGQGFWKEHSEAWKSSGLTQVAYCNQHNLSYQSFVYQHNRMANKAKRTVVNFIEAKPEKIATNIPTAGLQLMLPNGIRVSITNEVNAELLKTVLTVAGALPC